jgi:arylsulfatase A-like enzyme
VAAIGGADANQDATRPRRDNVLFVHWHDLGRYLGVYGHADVSSPRLDQLAAEGILFTRAHATAPLCSPSRGSLFTGRYPQSNGLVGLAHHGWEYRPGVRTLPQILSESGWYTALFGMQHETSHPSRLGFDEFDVSNSYCEYVVEQAQQWLRDHDTNQPFLLTAGFFETHRPYPHDRYEPADAAAVDTPDYLPDTVEVRQDLAEFYGSITTADAAVGRILDTLADTGLGRFPAGEIHALRGGNRNRDDCASSHPNGAGAQGLRRSVQRRGSAADAVGTARCGGGV